MITREDWAAWKNSPVTRKYLQDVNHTREGLKEALAEGQGTPEELDRLIGRCQGMKDAIDHALRGLIVEEQQENDDQT